MRLCAEAPVTPRTATVAMNSSMKSAQRRNSRRFRVVDIFGEDYRAVTRPMTRALIEQGCESQYEFRVFL